MVGRVIIFKALFQQIILSLVVFECDIGWYELLEPLHETLDGFFLFVSMSFFEDGGPAYFLKDCFSQLSRVDGERL